MLLIVFFIHPASPSFRRALSHLNGLSRMLLATMKVNMFATQTPVMSNCPWMMLVCLYSTPSLWGGMQQSMVEIECEQAGAAYQEQHGGDVTSPLTSTVSVQASMRRHGFHSHNAHRTTHCLLDISASCHTEILFMIGKRILLRVWPSFISPLVCNRTDLPVLISTHALKITCIET